MKRGTTAFVVVWCMLSVVCAAVVMHITLTDNTKIARMVLVNSLFLVGLGVFFAIFRDKISLLISNYEREKEI